jgi:hypothetical protein
MEGSDVAPQYFCRFSYGGEFTDQIDHISRMQGLICQIGGEQFALAAQGHHQGTRLGCQIQGPGGLIDRGSSQAKAK